MTDTPEGAVLPDPTTFPAWPIPAEPWKADDHWAESDYIRTVLMSRSVLAVTNGNTFVNQGDLTALLAGIVQHPDRLVTPANEDRVSDIGLDRSDIMGVVWGRPPEDAQSHVLETGWLIDLAWKKLTHKGDVARSKLLAHGVVMVESGSDLNRTVTKGDGTQVAQPVKLRFASTVPEKMLNYVVNPAARSAMTSLKKAMALVDEAMDQFPNDTQLFAGKVQAMLTETSGAFAPVLQRAGLILTPATVAALNGSKKAKAVSAPES